MRKKLKLGIFSFTGCEGCQVEILAQNHDFFRLLDSVEIVQMRLLKDRTQMHEMDVAVVEGAITTRKEIKELRKIRAKSETVVAIGLCATTGGYPAMRNTFPKELKERIKPFIDKYKQLDVKPAHSYVKVDYELHGCPPEGEKFIALMGDLIEEFRER